MERTTEVQGETGVLAEAAGEDVKRNKTGGDCSDGVGEGEHGGGGNEEGEEQDLGGNAEVADEEVMEAAEV